MAGDWINWPQAAGGMRCQMCGQAHLGSHICPGLSQRLPQYGWICPRCNKSNAPTVTACDCTPAVDLTSRATS